MNTETQSEIERTTQDKVQAWTEKHGVTMKAEFVPFSKSRYSDEKNPSLNWKITLEKNGREFLRCDYMQGSGHTPAYKANLKHLSPWEKNEIIKRECETGKEQRYLPTPGIHSAGKPIPPPSIVDVLACIVSDASAIDSPTYEDWASEFGYEADSRKGEAIYRQCLEHGLKLRAAVGDAGLNALRNATQDC